MPAAEPTITPELVSSSVKESPPAGVMQQEGRVARMREYFKNRPKEKIRIRPEDGEQWVQINGYAFRIQAGQDVKVPVDVADTLREAGVI